VVTVSCVAGTGDKKTATVQYVITIPAKNSVTATAVRTALIAVTEADWKTDVTTKTNAEGKKVEPDSVDAKATALVTVVTTTTTTTKKPTTTKAVTTAKKTNATTLTTTAKTTAAKTTAATSTAAKKVSGSLSLTLATKKQCDDLASTGGKTAMQKMLRDKAGLASNFDLTKIGVTVTCTANRRLSSEGRRLSTYTGKVGYTITVPAGHSVSATKVANSLNAVTADKWKSAVQTYASKEGKTITPTAVTATSAKATEINETSFAKSTSLMLGLMMIFRALL